MDKKEFTSKQTELFLDLIQRYGGENKLEFRRELKSFIMYDRMIFKTRILTALKSVL